MIERRKIVEILSIIAILLLFFGYPTYFFIFNNSPDIKHETNRWAIFWGMDDNKIALEVDNSTIWDEIQENWKKARKFDEPEYHMYIYGKVVPYDNSWGFRLKPSTIRSGFTQEALLSKSRSTIEHISTHLNYYLNDNYYIHIKNMKFYNSENAGVIPLSIDMIGIGVAILLIGLYFYFKREKELTTKIRELLTCYKDIPEGISIAQISKNIGLKQNRIEQLMNKNNLIDDLGLHVTDNQIQFKDLIYSQSISQIEEELPAILKLSINQITIDHYSLLHQFKKDLEEALVYFSKESINIGKQTQIKTTLELITELLDSIILDAINK